MNKRQTVEEEQQILARAQSDEEMELAAELERLQQRQVSQEHKAKVGKPVTGKQRSLLLEAKRRYTLFYPEEELMEAWTGLGYRSDYKPALEAGLMEWALHEPAFRCMGWLRLTESGAKIVQAWLDEEVTNGLQQSNDT